MSACQYDAIVVGSGHAGVEAALALARMHFDTLMLTLSLDTIAKMSCNPAIGGLAKGHLVREIDALGGEMAKAIDTTGIQFRMLNTSKGPAVWSPRAQADKYAYSQHLKMVLEDQMHLHLVQDLVSDLIVEGGSVQGVITERGREYYSKTVILTTGTFLKGLIHIGEYQHKAGRMGDQSAEDLSGGLARLGFRVGRLKTGTPARIHKRSIDLTRVDIQKNEDFNFSFSHFTQTPPKSLIECFITHTNEHTHDIIRKNLYRSAIYSGKMQSVGPRYCPSIEDKVVRFTDKTAHQLFLEPEGLHTNEVYINGLSSSLPEDIQHELIHSIKGLEHAEILRIGYAIEYDYCDPTQVYATLETKLIKNLYFAGQINGTTGYEEAAAQGLIAGINAALKMKGDSPFVMDRTESYIGVLIDDLTTKGVTEPYRMFTSRAEYRLNLRYDNADERLMGHGHRLGLIDHTMYAKLEEKRTQIQQALTFMHKYHIKSHEAQNSHPSTPSVKAGNSLISLLKRQDIDFDATVRRYEVLESLSPVVLAQLKMRIKYDGYIKIQNEQIKRFQAAERKAIPEDFDYDQVEGLLTEAREKLKQVQPRSLGQAARISGVNPSDISLLLVYLKQAV